MLMKDRIAALDLMVREAVEELKSVKPDSQVLTSLQGKLDILDNVPTKVNGKSELLEIKLAQKTEREEAQRRIVEAELTKKAARAEEYSKIAEAYKSGKTMLEVGRDFKVSPYTVQKALTYHGVKARKQGIKAGLNTKNKERAKLIEERLNDGKTMADIARELQITRERVRQICVKAGIDTEHRLTTEQKVAVFEYVETLDSVEFVAMKHGVHPSTLKNWITKAGYEVRPGPKFAHAHPITRERSKIAAELYGKGMKVDDIAAHLSLKKGTQVYRLLNFAGVPRRKQKQSVITTLPDISGVVVTDPRDDSRSGGKERWTEDELTTLRRLIGENKSFGQVAKALPGRTRSAVSGMTHRLGLRK
jgi:transposase-like protein